MGTWGTLRQSLVSGRGENWPQMCFVQFVSDNMRETLSKRANIAMDAAASLEDALLKHKEYFPAEL